MTASKPCCCLVLLVVAAAVHSRAYAAPAAATTRAAPTALAGLAAADTIEAADAGKCDAALAKGDKTFHGYCPCRCQLQPNKRFDCAKCPATCKRYGFLCKREAAVCTKRPPATTGVAWSECRHVLVGVKCQGYCQPGYTGPGAHTKCTAQGWSTPISSCVSKNKAAPAPVKVKQPQPPSPAGTPPAMSKQQAPRQQLPKTCSQAPPRVPGAKWARDCTNLAAGQSCSAYCGTGRPALAGYSARCNSNGIWSRPTGPGCSGLNPAKAKATMAAAAAAAAAPVRTGGAQVMLLEAATARNQADDAAPAKCAGNPPAVAGAVWQGCPGLEEGFGCLAQCTAPGMRGSYSALCGLGGVWQAAVSGCEQMTCSGSPKAVEGAVWPDCSGYLPGDQCVASGCSSGYIGQGYVANCMLDGSWGDVWGDCRKPGTVINTESGGNHL